MRLHLSVKAEYFEEIRAGRKLEEYRLVCPFWTTRLYLPQTPAGNICRREFDGIVLTLGYPKRGDPERTLEFPWRGFSQRTITHPHFGLEPVEVYAIGVRP